MFSESLRHQRRCPGLWKVADSHQSHWEITIMTAIHSPGVAVNGAARVQGLTDGSHLVVDTIKLNDVQTVYGLVGIPITDLARIAQASGLRYIGFRHESDAVHAAAAAGFLTKKPGI